MARSAGTLPGGVTLLMLEVTLELVGLLALLSVPSLVGPSPIAL